MGAVAKFLFNIIKMIAYGVFFLLKIVYRILSLLKIRLLSLYLLVCLILQYGWNTFVGETVVVFWAGVVAFSLVTVFAWVFSIRRWNEKRKEKKAVKAEQKAEKTQDKKQKTSEPARKIVKNYPVFFEAEGKPNHFYAEYEDRYELYRRDEGQMTYISTEKKEQ